MDLVNACTIAAATFSTSPIDRRPSGSASSNRILGGEYLARGYSSLDIAQHSCGTGSPHRVKTFVHSLFPNAIEDNPVRAGGFLYLHQPFQPAPHENRFYPSLEWGKTLPGLDDLCGHAFDGWCWRFQVRRTRYHRNCSYALGLADVPAFDTELAEVHHAKHHPVGSSIFTSGGDATRERGTKNIAWLLEMCKA